MSIVFTKSANGEATCLCNSIRLHSAYDPSHEALRFVQNVSCDFKPKYILVTGAALSYCAVYFRKFYPGSILCTVQYSSDFKITEKLWDKTFYPSSENSVSLAEQIYSFMGEEGIVSCLFVAWQPSEKAFPSESRKAWQEIKAAVLKSRNVLATRSFFARRWVRNSLRFCLFVKDTYYFQKGTAPIVVCASGPSLAGSIPYLKKNRERFFLLAVSSALRPLVSQGLIPDLCLSTDGGYWAKLHLASTLKAYPQIPLALSPESACFGELMENGKIVPISYGDGICEPLLSACGYSATPAHRNGTVSGTAAQLALELTTADVYFCGLDLAPADGYAHTQPNELENRDSLKDMRLATQDTRLLPSSFKSPALNIYCSWFSSYNFRGRLFRLSDNYQYKNTLGDIRDVSWDFFENSVPEKAEGMPMCFSSRKKFDFTKRYRQLQSIIKENLNNPAWIREAVPADYIVYERSIGMESEATALKKVQTDMQGFYRDIMRALAEDKKF